MRQTEVGEVGWNGPALIEVRDPFNPRWVERFRTFEKSCRCGVLRLDAGHARYLEPPGAQARGHIALDREGQHPGGHLLRRANVGHLEGPAAAGGEDCLHPGQLQRRPRQHSEGPAPGGRRFEHEQLGPGRGEIALGHRQVLRRDVRIRGLYPASTSEYTLKYLVAEVGTFA
jgi:hypothetical protein